MAQRLPGLSERRGRPSEMAHKHASFQIECLKKADVTLERRA
jgi:hypothetical protein